MFYLTKLISLCILNKQIVLLIRPTFFHYYNREVCILKQKQTDHI